jgi:hypothetical protein
LPATSPEALARKAARREQRRRERLASDPVYRKAYNRKRGLRRKRKRKSLKALKQNSAFRRDLKSLRRKARTAETDAQIEKPLRALKRKWGLPRKIKTVREPLPRPTPLPTPPPVYLSFNDFLSRMTDAELKKLKEKFNARAKKANRERLFSDAPMDRVSGRDVWEIFAAARGRCIHCGSLAVEPRPSRADGAPLPWEHIGRRIGCLEHLMRRMDGGGNELSNLAWACLWCNTWPEERRCGAADHGGFYPDEPAQAPPPQSPYNGERKQWVVETLEDEDFDDDSELLPDHEAPWATAMWRDTFG